jgi:hypothetical protein
MRTLIMLAAVGGISCFAAGASAQPFTTPTAEPMMQQADYYCGPECQRHRAWEAQKHAQRHQEWRESHQYNQYYRGY